MRLGASKRDESQRDKSQEHILQPREQRPLNNKPATPPTKKTNELEEGKKKPGPRRLMKQWTKPMDEFAVLRPVRTHRSGLFGASHAVALPTLEALSHLGRLLPIRRTLHMKKTSPLSHLEGATNALAIWAEPSLVSGARCLTPHHDAYIRRNYQLTSSYY